MAIRVAYARARHSPPDASFVEIYAIGILVNGSIEVSGVGRVFSKNRDLRETLRIGSFKPSRRRLGPRS